MRKTIKHIFGLSALALTALLPTSCVEDGLDASVQTAEQLTNSRQTHEEMLWGISSYMVKYNAWGGSDYLNDWGYPCQVYLREICGEDFPIYNSSYDYWTYFENGTYCSSYTYYTWNYYYRLIRNCNNLIGLVSKDNTDATSRQCRAQALAFRAMAYLDMARMFEYKPTGYPSPDSKAEKNGVWGLTVPIVTEKTTSADILSNPRADFCTMYRFIMTDLNEAERLLGSYDPADKSLPGIHAVYGLQARAWMEIGSRFEETQPQLQGYIAKMAESNTKNDGYDAIDAADANTCYANAATCADKAMNGYTPVTSAQWHSKTEGFNTANQAWIWRCRIGGKEQFPAYYCSYLGQAATEPEAGLPRYAEAYRCISSDLYSQIGDYDWRKVTWMSPTDAGKKSNIMVNKYQSLLADSVLSKIPAYANFKFRPGSGNISDYNVWLISDFPVMRMEEMKFIKAEAVGRSQGWSAGFNELKTFIANNRYSNASKYTKTVSDLESFMEELMVQKRIEFWGEGICYFDYKRLNLTIDRTTSSNVETAFQIKSRDGYCAAWLNFFIMQYETGRNSACIANPDVSGAFEKDE